MTITTDHIPLFKQQAVQWANTFEVCCCLDSCGFKDAYSQFDTLIAIGAKHSVTAKVSTAFNDLQAFHTIHPNRWMTGFIGYDVKNELEKLSSDNSDYINFPDLYFFVPEHLIVIQGDKIQVISDVAEEVVQAIRQQQIHQPETTAGPIIKTRLSKGEYISRVNRIKEHITRGDIYVTNFCQEFYAEDADIHPLELYQRLTKISPNPFSCFFKYHQHYIIGASPERYLAKRGHQLISQPIKGTAARSADNDEQVKQQLRQHPKEQQENVMIVDLVRNDLTRCAKPGTVKVDQLFGIYSFKQVHQMISTVSCELDAGQTTIDALKATFPMGSMTGAPKLKAMQLMEEYEKSKRGIYSGTVGYFTPDNDFDFNVVIRTLLYNTESRYLSFHTGSAITFDADAEQEYEECLLKAKAIREALNSY